MPFVNVHLVGPLNQEQKQKIAEDITNSLEKHAGKKKRNHLCRIFRSAWHSMGRRRKNEGLAKPA
jgi:hypothetical protein